MTIHISCSTLSVGVLTQLGYFGFFGHWWHDLHSGQRKTLHSAKHKKHAKKIENPLRGSISCAAALRRAVLPDDGIGAKPSATPIFDDRRKTTGKPSRVRFRSCVSGWC